MIFENSQDQFDIDLSNNIKKIGIKLSGGADSSIVCYMLAKYAKEERPDITIYPITGISLAKPYQEIFAKRVIDKIEGLLDYKFGEHIAESVRNDHYIVDQTKIVEKAYNKLNLDMHFAGITANPEPDDAPELFLDPTALPSDDRSKKQIKRPQTTPSSSTWYPLINVDKKGVKEHYERLGVLDTLFPITRSCEDITTDFSSHCGKCWFCLERKWGFGRLV